jgi:hypothetical protein
MGLTQSKPLVNDSDKLTPLIIDSTPTHSPGFNSPRRPPHPPSKPNKRKYLLFLDMDTTFENPPQLVAINAVMYRRELQHLHKEDSIDVLCKPQEGASIVGQMHELRRHGITVEMLANQGKAPSKALEELIDMINKCTGGNGGMTDPTVDITVVGYGLRSILAELMSCAEIDTSLHPYWEDLEALCQNTEDLLDVSVLRFPHMSNYRLEYVLSVLGQNLPPQSKSHAVAQLYVALHGVIVG